MKPPNFFIVGAPKCGTTALSEYLREHPRAFVTTPKEPHYFSHDFSYYHAPGQERLDHYLELYAGADERHLAVGEASVWYLYSREAVPAIMRFAPDARIIAMVRNPVEMVPSLHAQMRYMRDEDVPDVEAAWRMQERRRAGRDVPETSRVPRFLLYGETARLGEQVGRLMEAVPAERLKVIVFDDFRADAGRVYRETLEFLSLPDDGRTEFPRINEHKMHRAETVARLTQRPPRAMVIAARALKRLTGRQRLNILPWLRARNRVVAERQAISPEFAQELREYFAEDVALLGDLLDRDLSGWVREPVGVAG